jgi:hypothetical protein
MAAHTLTSGLSLVERPASIQAGYGQDRPKVLVLSSSLLIDRVLLYTEFLKVLNEHASVKVWATSAKNPLYRNLWNSTPAVIEDFPAIRPFREFPHNYLRRFNEFVWDYHHRPPSRLSMMKHVRDKEQQASIRALKLPARVLALLRMEEKFEDRLEQLLLSYQRCPEAQDSLQVDPPDVLLTTGPFQFEQPAIVANAKKLGIPTLALIPSWDNISTKNRMVLKCDGYLTWSEQARSELREFYPFTRQLPVYLVGAPQFDIFFQDHFYRSREAFCATQGLRADQPIILYAIGSPNFLRGERYGALYLAEQLMRGELGDVQMIVRPHPIHDNAEMTELFRPFFPRVIIQKTAEAGTALTARTQDERDIVEWVNSFRHADVVVNLSSTVTIDAAIFDRPVVNLDYDPGPGQPDQELIKDVNHRWTHFKPVAESGGVWLVNNHSEMLEAVKTYLAHPELHREKRRQIAEYVCGYIDGQCGERMAQAVVDFVQNHTKSRAEYVS